jgi:hypothetical protein
MSIKAFPSQKKKFATKGKKWKEDHFGWAKNAIYSDDSQIRTSVARKERNVLSYLGRIDVKEYMTLLNPNALKKFAYPTNIQHHPIAAPYLNVLIGEEFDRRFEWKAILTNPNAISKIEIDKRKMFEKKIQEIITDPGINEQEATDQLKAFDYYVKFEYQDIREKRANLLLRHYIKELDLKMKFNAGFKDVLLNSEEAYIGDVFNNRPSIEKMDQKTTFVVRSGNSNRYEDADVIINYAYEAPGMIQDRYYRYLSEADTKWIDEATQKISGSDGSDLDRDEHGINLARREMMRDYVSLPKGMGSDFSNGHSEISDSEGNIRVIRLFWKSRKLIKRVKSYDKKTGKPVYDYQSETYVPKTEEGEEAEDYWVSQWWEGVEIGDGIYPYIKPRDIQYNKFDDPGYNHPGIIGQIYSINSYKASSMMDMAFPYQLMYDATFHRMQDAMSKFFGSLVVVDLASLPPGWDLNKWMFFAKKAGIAVKDSFKEGNKGMATGKLAGGIPNSGQSINQQLGDFIQQQINILNYVEQQMGRIVGVPPQRLGDIQNRETVGGVERAVTQSSYITNERFKIHDNVKKRVLTMLLELCKVAYKGSSAKFQFIGDDYVNQIFEIDDEFSNEEYGILVDNETDLSKIEQMMDGLTQAAMQTQAIRYSDVFKIYNSSSLSEKQRIIEKGEEDLMKRKEQAQQAQLESDNKNAQAIQQQAQANQEMIERHHNDNLEADKYKVDQDNLTKRMALDAGIEEVSEADPEARKYDLEDRKMNLEYDKLSSDSMQSMLDLDERIRNNREKEKIEKLKVSASKTKARI